MLFQLLGVFAEFERSMIRSRVIAGLDRVRGKKRLGRPPMPTERIEQIKAMLLAGRGIRETARETGAGTASAQRNKQSLAVTGTTQRPSRHEAWPGAIPQAIMIVSALPV